MPEPVVIVNNAQNLGQNPCQQLSQVTMPYTISCQAWAIAPATSIQDGTNGTNPIQFSIDGGAQQNVTLTSPGGTPNPMFTIPLTAANTGGAGGAKIGHTVQVIVLDNNGLNKTLDLTVLRAS